MLLLVTFTENLVYRGKNYKKGLYLTAASSSEVKL